MGPTALTGVLSAMPCSSDILKSEVSLLIDSYSFFILGWLNSNSILKSSSTPSQADHPTNLGCVINGLRISSSFGFRIGLLTSTGSSFGASDLNSSLGK